MLEPRQLVVAGAIANVLTCRCTTDDMVEVSPEGWGVGAGAIGRDRADALDRVVDATFLFSTAFISPTPTAPGTAATAAQLQAGGQRYFAPTMSWFTAGSPDLLLSSADETSQGALLEDLAWRELPDAAAIGVVSLVRVRRTGVAAALIRTSVALGHEHLPAGHVTSDPDLRERFFDLRPLARRPAFAEGLGWLVCVSVRHDAANAAPPAIRERMVGHHAAHGLAHHSHLVLVDDAPTAWRNRAGTTWADLSATAASSIQAHAASALALHSDAATVLAPLTTAVWSFDAADIRST